MGDKKKTFKNNIDIGWTNTILDSST